MQGDYLVLFNYQAYSFRAEKILQDLGLVVDFIPTPRQYGELCANSLRVRGMGREKLMDLLAQSGITYAAVHPYIPSKLSESFLQDRFSDNVESIFKKIREDNPLKRDDIEILFHLAKGDEQEYFFRLARELRNKVLGKSVILGALFGLHKSFEPEELFKFTRLLVDSGINHLMLQLDEKVNWDNLLQFLDKVKTISSLQLMVTGGINLFLHYRDLQKAGVPYIFKQITLEEQGQFLANPQDVLEEIFFLWQEGKSTLLGLSPLLPMPYSSENPAQSKGKITTALLRVLFKDSLLPAFNCLTSLATEEQLANMEAGANLVLVDFTTQVQRGGSALTKLDDLLEILAKRGYTTNILR